MILQEGHEHPVVKYDFSEHFTNPSNLNIKYDIVRLSRESRHEIIPLSETETSVFSMNGPVLTIDLSDD